MSWGKQRKVQNYYLSHKIRKQQKSIKIKSVVNISYKIKFINSERIKESSLSNLVDNLAEGIHKIKCKDCDYFVEYKNVKDNLIKYKCLSCNEDYSNKLDEFFSFFFN